MGALEAALSQVARMGAGCCLSPIFGAAEAVGNLEPTQKASPGHLENQEGKVLPLNCWGSWAGSEPVLLKSGSPLEDSEVHITGPSWLHSETAWRLGSFPAGVVCRADGSGPVSGRELKKKPSGEPASSS